MSIDAKSLPVTLPGGCAFEGRWIRELRLRPWDCLDLEATAQPIAAEIRSAARRTTAILARCVTLNDGQPVDEGFVRNLIIGDREALLLHLQRISSVERFDCVLVCPECRERMDLGLELGDLLLAPYGHSQLSHVTIISDDKGDSFEVRFRLPNGADQEVVAALALRDPAAAARVLLERCIETIDDAVPKTIPDVIAVRLPDAMAKLDPQSEVVLHARCPSCNVQFESLFDASRVVHAAMDQAWIRLRHEVHRLALHYHWTETEILALSNEKRRLYCELIRQEQESLQREYRREPRREYHLRGLA